jgi:hypothetical protein
VQTRLANGLTGLTLYTRILGGQREVDRQTVAHAELKLSGLVKREDTGNLVVRNKIYRRLFDAKWAAGVMPARPGSWYRTYAIAASILLLALIGGGGSYYLLHILPALQARSELLALHVELSDAKVGLRGKFPSDLSQADIEKAIAALAKVGQVTELSLNPVMSSIGSNARLDDLSSSLRFFNVSKSLVWQVLKIDRSGIVDIAPLARLTALQKLGLGATEVADITPLARLTGLQTLDLGETKVAGLSGISCAAGG